MTHQRPNDPQTLRARRGYSAPKRSLGQNFLTDPNIARKIVAALEIGPDDDVLEIGPGRGALTRHIWDRAPRRFRVVEKDDELAGKIAAEHPETEVVRGDALRLDWQRELPAEEKWKIVGNLPYNIASPLIWNLVGAGSFERAVFMVQLEVGRRLAAAPGCREYGALSVWVQSRASVELLFKVPPQVFYPRPKVTSAVVRFFLNARLPSEEEASALDATLKLCFRQRRKQLGTILKSKGISEFGELLAPLGIDPSARPETLAAERFLALAKILKRNFPA